jgi:hypothetical protein
MSRYIVIDKSITEDTTARGHRLKMTVMQASNVSDKIFLWQYRAAVAPQTIDSDEFLGVASVADINEYPEDSPAAPPATQYYRLTTIDLIFRNIDTLERAVKIIQEDIRDLLNNLDIIDDQAATTPVVITGD